MLPRQFTLKFLGLERNYPASLPVSVRGADRTRPDYRGDRWGFREKAAL